jgi:hypothetical protein
VNHEKRTVQFHFMASGSEAEMIGDRMEAAGVKNISAYLRKMAIDGYIIHMDMKDIRELVSLLRRCSNNLNQYARRANETGSIYEGSIEDLKERFEALWDMASAILSGFAKLP